MTDVSLVQIAMLLGAAAVAAPLARWLRIGSVLGYLGAGVVLGPYGLGQVFSLYEAKEILHVAEFGVVLLLFLIGLELKPKRLWAMRQAIFGAGLSQVAITAVAIMAIGSAASLTMSSGLFVGIALALSSTAFALQVLEENGELAAKHGRLSFAILLMQDLAAIPVIALAPMFAASLGKAGAAVDGLAVFRALGVIAGVVIVGHFLLEHVLRLIARTKVKEAMTAAALLTVVGVSLVMQKAGLTASLGAFIAGALLAESSYRHQLEADIKPFEGLLLGLFFTAIGMSLNLGLLADEPALIMALVAVLVTLKAAVLYLIGRWNGLDPWGSRRMALSLSQGGEFAFVLFTAGVAAGVLGQGLADQFALVVTLSMVATPLLLLADSMFLPRQAPSTPTVYDSLPEADGHVIIAGLGRFGQIAARVLRAKHIPVTALDISPDQIDLVRRFGSKAFFGDASRPDILEAAQADKARAFVLAIDDVEASMETARIVKERYPGLKIYARARNRVHAHRLMDLGVEMVERETFLSALELTRQMLRGIGFAAADAERAVRLFEAHDRRRLEEDYKDWTDEQKLREKARSDAANLEQILQDDAAETAIQEGAASRRPPGQRITSLVAPADEASEPWSPRMPGTDTPTKEKAQ